MAAARVSTSDPASGPDPSSQNGTIDGRPRHVTPAAPPFVLLDDNLSPGGRARLYHSPVEIICCQAPEEVPAAMRTIAGAASHGLHAAGYFSYELGYLLEEKLTPWLPARRALPLLWVGLFAAPTILDGAATEQMLANSADAHSVENLRLSIDRTEYLAAVRRVKDYILAGDVYQINLTFKVQFDFAGDPISLYAALRRQQPVAHGALIRTGSFDVLSLSPELFVETHDGQATARPMKGTASRGATPEQDAARRAWLHSDEKSRAENLMIVDLLRNDLGRVAEVGSVRVPDLFSVETYPTVHQMTSTISSHLRPDVGAIELLQALFPCGSVTGAPKVRAMEIIRELEPAPRGIYTGAIGVFGPDGDTSLNVAIRTLVLDQDGNGEMGIGSGIVHDSDATAEFEECLLKAQFLGPPLVPFELIETLRWSSAEGFYLLELHLARLAASANHFGFDFDPDKAQRALTTCVEGRGGGFFRVRLLLDPGGRYRAAVTPIALPSAESVQHFTLSEQRIDSGDDIVYHKTTRREVYEGELARLSATTGCDEVIFCNERGELTEGSRTNLFLQRAGRLLTPPVACGLLNGILRQALFNDPEVAIEECVLFPSDLATAKCVFLGNSVRGLVHALPIAETPPQRLAKG